MFVYYYVTYVNIVFCLRCWGRRGGGRMVVECIATWAISYGTFFTTNICSLLLLFIYVTYVNIVSSLK